MDYLKALLAGIVGGALVFVFTAVFIQDKQYGASYDATTNTNPQVFDDTVTIKGAMTFGDGTADTAAFAGKLTTNAGHLRSYTSATSSNAALTLIEADILNYDTITATLNGGAKTFTLPATSTLTNMIPTAGDMQETCWIPSAALTFAAGTGIDLETSSSTPTDLTITGGNIGCMRFIRATSTDVFVTLTEYVNGD